MRCVVQRVKEASVTVDGETVGKIGPGVLALIGVSTEDTEREAEWLADKVCGLRVFEDEAGKMNLSLDAVGGKLLVVSQFTLYGDARGGRRPSYIRAAAPEVANAYYERLVNEWRNKGIHVETGRFRTEMQVSLINDGPVTILLDSEKNF